MANCLGDCCRLGQNITFHASKAKKQPNCPSNQLILLFGWMLAQRAHLQKYCDFWNARGYDILLIETVVIDFLYPPYASERNFRGILKFWSQSCHGVAYDRVLIHSFSVGGYASIDFLNKLRHNAQCDPNCRTLFGSLQGLIMDSLTFVSESPIGIATALTSNYYVQWLIRSSLCIYLQLTRPIVLGYCGRVEAALYENPWKLPGLFLFSRNDPIALSDTMFKLIQQWKTRGVQVRGKCWDQSPHVGHYKQYPKEYEAEVEHFLQQLYKVEPIGRNI